MPLESAVVFYPKYVAETLKKWILYFNIFFKMRAIYRKVMRDPNRLAHTDIAITPCDEGEVESLAIFNETQGDKAAVDKARAQEDRRERVESRLAKV